MASAVVRASVGVETGAVATVDVGIVAGAVDEAVRMRRRSGLPAPSLAAWFSRQVHSPKMSAGPASAAPLSLLHELMLMLQPLIPDAD